MKELSIEEKAKRYDKTLERAKAVIEQNPLMEYLKKGIEYIFPELKKSEDEKIRKEIIKYLEQTVPHHHRDEVLKSKEWIAWLEKQGEQNTAWGEEDETMTTNTIIMLKGGASLHFNKKDITKAIDWLKSLKGRVLPQPTEWSDEDEVMLENVISSISHESVIEGLKSRGISYSIDSSTHLMENLIIWLKSLRNNNK